MLGDGAFSTGPTLPLYSMYIVHLLMGKGNVGFSGQTRGGGVLKVEVDKIIG